MKKILGIILVTIGILLLILVLLDSNTEMFMSSAPYASDLLPHFIKLNAKINTAKQATCVSNYTRYALIQEANKLTTKSMEIYGNPEIKTAVDTLKTNLDTLLISLEHLPPCRRLCEPDCKDCNNILTDIDGRRYCNPLPPPEPKLNWKLIPSDNAPSKRHSSMRWVDKSGNLWIYGGEGENATPLYDMWMWDGSKWMVMNSLTSPPVYKGGMCWTTPDNKLWMFGGTTTTDFATNQMWVWEGEWNLHNQCCKEILPRTNGAIWTDLQDNTWLFGGQLTPKQSTNDLWKWDGNWTLVNPSSTQLYYKVRTRANQPRPRHGAMTWTDYKNNLWMFGGRCEIGDINDMWRWDGISWTWYSGSEGATNLGQISNTDAYNNVPRGTAYGISWENKAKTVLWMYDGLSIWNWDVNNNTWLWRGDQDLAYRTKTSSGISMLKRVIFVFGGMLDDGSLTNELWQLN